jgi:hypothetical protein
VRVVQEARIRKLLPALRGENGVNRQITIAQLEYISTFETLIERIIRRATIENGRVYTNRINDRRLEHAMNRDKIPDTWFAVIKREGSVMHQAMAELYQ